VHHFALMFTESPSILALFFKAIQFVPVACFESASGKAAPARRAS
jgi:hypothetical protein